MNSIARSRVRCTIRVIKDGIRRDAFPWRRYISTSCHRCTLTNRRNSHIGETFRQLPLSHSFSQSRRCLTSSTDSTGSVKAADVNVTSRCVTVTYNDGTKDKFPFLWLRDNCQCEECFNPHSLARSFLMKDLRLDITPKSVKVCTVLFN